jgi:predicted nucleotide-binding protein
MAGKAESAPEAASPAQREERKRQYLSQADVPAFSIAKALRVPRAIADNYAKAPTKPLRVAQALNMQPSSSQFRMLAGSAIAYGLTDGGYNAETISLTPLGKRIVAPTTEGDETSAMREAMLRPRVVREFLTKYDGSRIPPEHIARNVLEEMGVPTDRTQETLSLIMEGAREIGFLQEVKGQTYVDLDGAHAGEGAMDYAPEDLASSGRDTGNGAANGNGASSAKGALSVPAALDSDAALPAPAAAPANNRVFITHGKNTDVVGQLKELLSFGKFDPVVSVEKESVSKPVPDKVMDDMRSCAAAIIHVGTEQRMLDDEGNAHNVLNSNVLIEIGAAMALYRRNFILLVEKGVTLPSNLQGLYEVRYEGNRLDYEATMKLLKAFNDFRK